MRTMKHFLIVLLVLTSQMAFSQGLQPLPMDSAVRYGTLENGLTYYIRHNQQPKDRAEFYIAQNVGAILETDEQNGLAHFLEHMAFNGTKNYPGKQFINYFETIGVRFGNNINAYTSLDETVYNLSDVPTYREGVIDSALLILHDWSGFISLEEAEIDQERGVIREEWRQRRTATRRLFSARNQRVFPASQYAKRDVIGDTAVINNFSYDTLRAYYKKWYRPDQQAILIVGDIDVDQIESKIKTLFSDIPKPVEPAERIYYPVHDNAEPIVAVLTDPEAPSTQIRLEYRLQPLPNEVRLSVQGYAVTLVNRLISAMTNTRITDITKEADSPFTGGVGTITALTRTKDMFVFLVEPVSGKEDAARKRLLQEIEIIKQHGFTPSELERAKANFLSSLEKSYNERNQQRNNQLVQEYTRHFLESEGIPGIEWEYNFTQSLLPALQLGQINQIAQQYLSQNAPVYTVSGPIKEALQHPDETQLLSEIANMPHMEIKAYEDISSNIPLVDEAIKSGKVKKVKPGLIEGTTEWKLSNGVTVLVKPTTFKQDEIRMQAWSNGGLSLVSEEALPSAMLSTTIVSQSGLGQFSLTELSKVLSGKIVRITPQISDYTEGLNGTSSVKDLETLLQLTYLYFTSVRTDEAAYTQTVKSIETSLENRKTDPKNSYLDSINLYRNNFHPRKPILDEQLLQEVSLNEVMDAFKQRFANPADFTFLFVGNFEEETLKQLVEKYLGGLKTYKKKEQWEDHNIRPVTNNIQRDFLRDLHMNKVTNFIEYTAEVPYTLENRILITMLSNLLDLRYTATIREEEGATYGVGVGGSLQSRPIPIASLNMFFETDPGLYKDMLKIIHNELKKIASEGPLASDLEKVRLNLLKDHKENLQENAWWSQVIQLRYETGLSYPEQYEQTVEKLSGSDVQKIAERLVASGNSLELILLPNIEIVK